MWDGRHAAALVFAGLVGCEAHEGPVDPSEAGGAGTGGGAPSTTTTETWGPAASTGAGGDSGGPGFPIPDWPVGAPEDHGFDPAALAHAVAVAEAEGSYCLLIVKDGVLVSESYWAGRDATSADASFSLAKSYTSTLVGIALERGDIAGLDQSASDYLPAWQGTDHEAITIRHLVSMTSGLAWSAFSDYVSMVTFAEDHTAFALAIDVAEPPGSSWVYHNGGVQILEPLLANATHMSMEQYAEQHLWSKLGMSASWGKDPSGNETAYANVLASCRDHARFGYLFLRNGRWGDEQVVPEAWVAEALSPSQEHNRAYGFLWWLNGETPAIDAFGEPWEYGLVPFAPPDLFAARGFGNQFIDVIPSLDLVVVRTGPDPVGAGLDLDELAADQHFAEHDAILGPILASLSGP
jgi:CubicO group peptidase (beta-lactamase class C family)